MTKQVIEKINQLNQGRVITLATKKHSHAFHEALNFRTQSQEEVYVIVFSIFTFPQFNLHSDMFLVQFD